MTGKLLSVLKKCLLKALYCVEPIKLSSIRRSAENYDMVKEENEKFFSEIYLHFIEKRINDVFGAEKVKILDAGCGQARISIPLATAGHGVTGIDLSSKAIDSAKQYSSERMARVDFIAGDLRNVIKKMGAGSFDCIICLEVLYFLADYNEVISGLVRLLKKNGLLILSLRPKFYYIRWLILNNMLKEAAEVVLKDAGSVGLNNLNCQSLQEMTAILQGNGLKEIEARGIGILSGIDGDPQAKFLVPSQIPEKEWDLLFKMELDLSTQFCSDGRYILISGVK